MTYHLQDYFTSFRQFKNKKIMKDTSTFSDKATQVLISKKSEYIFVLVY